MKIWQIACFNFSSRQTIFKCQETCWLMNWLVMNNTLLPANQVSIFFSNSTPSVGKNGLFKVKVDFYLTAIFFFLGLKNSNEVIWLGCQVINQVVIQFRWNTNWVSRFFPHFSTQSRDWSWRSAAEMMHFYKTTWQSRKWSFKFQLFFWLHETVTAAGSIYERWGFWPRKTLDFLRHTCEFSLHINGKLIFPFISKKWSNCRNWSDRSDHNDQNNHNIKLVCFT